MSTLKSNSIDPRQLRVVVEEFYRKVFSDMIIGYLFRDVDFEEIVGKQVSFTGAMLGICSPYSGPALNVVHGPLKIRPAQFSRRRKILSEVLEDSTLPRPVIDRWLSFEDRLQSVIVGI